MTTWCSLTTPNNLNKALLAAALYILFNGRDTVIYVYAIYIVLRINYVPGALRSQSQIHRGTQVPIYAIGLSPHFAKHCCLNEQVSTSLYKDKGNYTSSALQLPG